MGKISLTALAISSFFLIHLHAQEKISREGQPQPATFDQETSAKRDTSDQLPIESNLYWYDIDERLSVKTDSSKYEIYRLADEKELIYTDMSDIFRSQPLWFDFDLIEPGRPAYISLVNTYPHQTPLFFGGVLMNDQLQGTFNTQFVPLNYIQFAEADYTSGSLRNYALWSGSKLNITPQSVHTSRPWTKILYKQGSYGYSDVDIHFEIPLTKHFAVQLGGKNSSYDGAIQGPGYDGQNYRAEITWQYSPNLYLRSQLFMNRIKTGLSSFDSSQEFAVPSTNEKSNDLVLDLTWLRNDSLGQRLHALIYYSDYTRKFKDTFTTYAFETWSRRFGFDVNYNFLLGTNKLLVGTSTLLPTIWGDPFDKKLSVPSFNGYSRLNLSVNDNITFRSALQLALTKDYNLKLLPALGIDFVFSKNQCLSFEGTTGERIPNVTERFFDWDTLYGNQKLRSETYSTIGGHYFFQNANNWHFKIDAGYNRIGNEIVWKDSVFSNQGTRDYTFYGAEGFLKVWWIDVTLAGQYTFAKVNLTPKSSIWGQAHLNWILLNGALILDAYGTLTWYDKHQEIKYQPKLDRFYTGTGQSDSFITLAWKVVATVQSARIFFEMDNAIEENYEIVSGYPDFYRRFRLGVNWTLWD